MCDEDGQLVAVHSAQARALQISACRCALALHRVVRTTELKTQAIGYCKNKK